MKTDETRLALVLALALANLVLLAGLAFGADVDTAMAVAEAASPDAVPVSAWVAAILGVLLAISELLALIPGVRNKGIFNAIYRGLKDLSNKGSK